MSRKGFKIMYKYLPLIFSNRLLGFLSFDVDVSRLDINQCDSDLSVSASQLQTFKGTHKCHSETSQVRNWIIPIIKFINSKYCKFESSRLFLLVCKAHSLVDLFCALILRFHFPKKISFRCKHWLKFVKLFKAHIIQKNLRFSKYFIKYNYFIQINTLVI